MKLAHLACCAVIALGCDYASQVRQVYMALDGSGLRVRNEFFTDTKEIWCDVVWSGRGTDNSVQAIFTQTHGEQNLFDGSNPQPFTQLQHPRQWSANEVNPPPGIQTVAFGLPLFTDIQTGNPLPYPVGIWKCTITVNGENAGESDFTINYPPAENGNPNGCPPAYVTSTGNSCVGYVANAHCPSAEYADNPNACSCDIPTDGGDSDRIWVCIP
jgi:hypothetical protein